MATARFVGIAFFGSSTVGMVMLMLGATGTAAIAGAALCGVGIGAEVDLMAFLITRYFGLTIQVAYGLVFANRQAVGDNVNGSIGLRWVVDL